MQKPYFETEFGKLFHGDCLEILKSVGDVDAVITDPPFAFTGGISNGSSANVSEQFFRHWWVDVCQSLAACLLPTASGFIWCDWKTAKILSDGFEPKTQTYDVFRVAQMLYHFREMPGMGPESWVTPKASDSKSPGKSRDVHLPHQTGGPSNKLNPNWVEQLMGLPTGWTALDCSETVLSRLQRQKHLLRCILN